MVRTDEVFVIDIGDDENMTTVAWCRHERTPR